MSDGARDAETRPSSIASDVAHAETVAARTARRSVPARIGRYVVVRELGDEAWEAEDPELGRRVAIRTRPGSDAGDPSIDELRALTRLVHPNVVAVYDVSSYAGEVFIVTQLVDGESLDRCAHARRTPAAILAAFRKAGRGLAAAHAAGLVHGRFAAGCVVVDRSGGVRVGDFALGTGATPASDQHAFCVALYEMLAGERVDRHSALPSGSAAPHAVPLLPRSRASARVAQALVRGTGADPAARFATMDELLGELAPRRRAWLFAISAAAVGAAVIAAIAAVVVLPGSARVESLAPTPAPAPVRAPPHLTSGPDPGPVLPLTSYGSAGCAFAPAIDGDDVVFDRTLNGAVDLYAVALAGGTPRQLTDAPTWEWHAQPGPQPGQILYVAEDPDNAISSRLAVLDRRLGTSTVIAAVTAADAVATGTEIIYLDNVQHRLVRRNGSDEWVFAAFGGDELLQSLAISHHRDRIATVIHGENSGRRLCVYDVATQKPRCFPSEAYTSRVAFGGDDRFVYYDAWDGIHIIDIRTASGYLLVPDVDAGGGLAVPVDGSALVYSSCKPRPRVYDRSTVPAALLLDDPAAQEVSVAADTVAWTRSIQDVHCLVVRGADGRERQLTGPSYGGVWSPALSPNGRWLAFRATGRHAGTHVVDLKANARFIAISDDVHDTPPRWLGDGELLFGRVDADEGTAIAWHVATPDGSSQRVLELGAILPAGGWPGHVLAVAGAHLIWVDEVSGAQRPGPPTAKAVAVSRVTTSPDGRWLMYAAAGEGTQTYRQRLDPLGEAEPIAPVTGGATVSAAAITDAGHVIMTVETWTGDLHVIRARPGSRF
jgi:hypothetical protein